MNLDGSGFTTVRTLNAPPRGTLLEASDGAIYGAVGGRNAVYRGGDDPGFIYRVNKDGSGFAVIHSFSWDQPSLGWAPNGALIESADGFLYGTTSRGGTTDRGTIFRLSKNGKQHMVL